MRRALDGSAFKTYCRRLGFAKKNDDEAQDEAQDVLIKIRSAPPTRTPGSNWGNVAVWYPSKKMRFILKAESHKVEFARMLQHEHDDDVLEYYDQPPSIPIEYFDKNNHLQRVNHTPDYFVFRYGSAGWEECKPQDELIRQAQQRPNRYRLDEEGRWRCPPGETYAAKYGLTYRVWSSDEINWAAQSNWQYLEDYYQDLERLQLSDDELEKLHSIVVANPGIKLADLRLEAQGIPSDLINIAIARHDLYVDMNSYRLCDPERTPVFRDQKAALKHNHSRDKSENCGLEAHPVVIARGNKILLDSREWYITNDGPMEIILTCDDGEPFPMPRATFEKWASDGKIVGAEQETYSSISEEGQERLEEARAVDSARAIFRNRVIHPEDYDDDEQTALADQLAKVHKKTKRTWRQKYREAEIRYGNGLFGLIPNYSNCGRKGNLEACKLIDEVLEIHYNNVTRKPKRGAYGAYVTLCEERGVASVSQRAFYAETQRWKTKYELTLAREGARAAYPFKNYEHPGEKTINRHGDYAWAKGHLDHLEVDLMLLDSKTRKPLGKCWLTLLILAHPRRIAAFYLSFDPPSYRSCMMVLRLCVKRHNRLPSSIVVDGGPEFKSIYFEQLLALYRVRKERRPTAEPRFGSPLERLFGTAETEFIHHLLGNTQATKKPRHGTKATDPKRQAVWTLEALAEYMNQWAYEDYDTIPHPALHGQSPREAYEQSMKQDGERSHKKIPYDKHFIRATYPSTRAGEATVHPGRGVRMNYLDYWCVEMLDAEVEGTKIPVRFDPFDVSTGYAYIDGKWRECKCANDEFVGCSERELRILSEELRKEYRELYGRKQVEVTQKKLAARRSKAESTQALLQQQKDRETKAAFEVLEGGKRRKQGSTHSSSQSTPSTSSVEKKHNNDVTHSQTNNVQTTHPAEKLIVLKRYR
jgi:putative transposase